MQDETATLEQRNTAHGQPSVYLRVAAVTMQQHHGSLLHASAVAVAAPRSFTCLLDRSLADANSDQTPSSACRAAVTPAAAATATAAWAALA